MKQQDIFRKIGSILRELNDQYEYLGNGEEPHSDLELELFVANAHFLAEHSDVLRKLNAQNQFKPTPALPEPAPKPQEKYFEPVVQQVPPEPEPVAPPKPAEPEDRPVPHIDLTANGADDDFSVVRHDEPGVIKHELVLDESQIWEDEDDTGFEINEATEIDEPVSESPKATVPEPQKSPEPEPLKEAPQVKAPEAEPAKPVPPIEAPRAPTTLPEITAVVEAKVDPEPEEPLTINQRISAQLNKTSRLSENLHANTITDLKQAINLNDKLLYIRDLFNGYSLAYSEAIDLVNRCQSFTEAEDFLRTNYAVKNQWDSKQATVDKFYDLLRRRFS